MKLEEEYEKIYTFCYFKVKNKSIAEDITQETFLKYFETNTYLEKGKKLAFLYTIARNCCMDYFRKLKYETPNDEIEKTYDKSNDIDIQLTVREAILSLSLDDQEIILLRFKNELRVGELANYLGISRFAVYRRLQSIIKKLEKILREEDFYE